MGFGLQIWQQEGGSEDGQWRWRAYSHANGQILASGEQYHNDEDLIDTLRTLFGATAVLRAELITDSNPQRSQEWVEPSV